MSRQDDLKEIRELTIKLNQWCYEYYALSKPSVSNDVFDQNFDRLKYLEDKTGFFFSGSPVRTVGFRVSSELPKIKHSSPLLSLYLLWLWLPPRKRTKQIPDVKTDTPEIMGVLHEAN